MDAASEPVKPTPSLIHRRIIRSVGRRPVISTAVDFQARSHRLVRLLAQTLDTEAAGLSEALLHALQGIGLIYRYENRMPDFAFDVLRQVALASGVDQDHLADTDLRWTPFVRQPEPLVKV